MKIFVKTFAAMLGLLVPLMLDAQDDFDCFGVIVGKDASVDGSVILGHNEDDKGEQMLNIYKSPHFLWAEFPGKEVADAFMNCHGVSIVSDKCRSREDREDYPGGGILYGIRLHAAMNAVSARDAVRIIGEDVEKYGYAQSGRSYLVADTKEGWVVSIAQGCHWVAQRVPDDKVMVIPNCYTISEVDLSDTLNFAGCPDLVEYAQSRGWYDPERDGAFSFKKAYGLESNFHTLHNTGRHEAAVRHIRDDYGPFDEMTVPFAITPSHKFSIRDVMSILKDHSDLDESGKHPARICVNTTVVSTVFQLRGWLPLEIGCVMWMCPTKTCSQPYIPWYLGMTEIPARYHRFDTVGDALLMHMSDCKNLRKDYPDGLYWDYVASWEALEADYAGQIKARTKMVDRYQKEIFNGQGRFERKLLRSTPEEASALMNRRVAELVETKICR